MRNYLLMGSLLLFISCGGSNNGEENQEGGETELTYTEMEQMVFEGMDDGTRIEWHGTELTNEAVEFITISESGDCKTECGKGLQIQNTSEKSIEVVVKADFSIGERTSYMARLYQIEPGEILAAGCTHLCINDAHYLFERAVVGAEFNESE